MDRITLKDSLRFVLSFGLKRRRPTWREKMLEVMSEQDINPESEKKFKWEYECGRGCRCENGYPEKHDSGAFCLGFEDEMHNRPAPTGLDQF